jgi:hypothetical protein
VQEQLAAAKARQVRRAQTLARNVAAEGDTFEHQVESAEELTAIHDEQRQQPDRRRRRKPQPPSSPTEPPESHIDITV